MSNVEPSIELRVELLELQGDPWAPPPEGVECDCEDSEHAHIRVMTAECDKCGVSLGKIDLLAYTRAEGFLLLRRYAESRDWSVSWEHYLCPDCSKA